MTEKQDAQSSENEQKITEAFEKIISGPGAENLNTNAIGIDIGTSKTVCATLNKEGDRHTTRHGCETPGVDRTDSHGDHAHVPRRRFGRDSCGEWAPQGFDCGRSSPSVAYYSRPRH